MAKRKKGLGERHKRILNVLERFTNQNGYPPSIREIGAKADISSTSVVNYYLEQLEKMGYIERDRNVSRGVRVLKDATGQVLDQVQEAAEAVRNAVEDLLHIPVVGRIVASEPVPIPASDFSLYDPETMVNVARSLVPGQKQDELYALEVQGNSMIDAMVNDGDIVIMKRAVQANNGDMVAVFLQDKEETTLKYFFKEKNRIRLQPANPTMEPIYVNDQSMLQVQGKVVMVIRQVSERKVRFATGAAH
jgi:repressor LexA